MRINEPIDSTHNKAWAQLVYTNMIGSNANTLPKGEMWFADISTKEMQDEMHASIISCLSAKQDWMRRPKNAYAYGSQNVFSLLKYGLITLRRIEATKRRNARMKRFKKLFTKEVETLSDPEEYQKLALYLVPLATLDTTQEQMLPVSRHFQI